MELAIQIASLFMINFGGLTDDNTETEQPVPAS